MTLTHQLIIFVASYFIILSLIMAFLVWLKLSWYIKKEFVICFILAAILTFALAQLAGALFYNPRPFVVGHFSPLLAHGNDNGFPSDHALLASFLDFMVWQYNRLISLILLLLAITIGLARVLAGVHHLIDIIGAFAISAFGVVVAIWIIKAIKSVHNTRQL